MLDARTQLEHAYSLEKIPPKMVKRRGGGVRGRPWIGDSDWMSALEEARLGRGCVHLEGGSFSDPLIPSPCCFGAGCGALTTGPWVSGQARSLVCALF
jgi:hypothetical protein